MPELPEVETVLLGLRKNIVGKKIQDIFSSGARVFRTDPARFPALLVGKTVTHAERRGKYIKLEISGCYLVIHLGMSGRLYRQKQVDGVLTGIEGGDKHVHMFVCFDSCDRLIYRDPRKFGRIFLFETEEELHNYFRRLGIEPLSPEFTYEAFQAALAGKTGMIKPFLLNQGHICGLGNIYADEALFRSGIHPETSISCLGANELRKLHKAIPQVLKMGIRFGGTTFRDYRNSEGMEGSFQTKLNVYGRSGQICRICGNRLEQVRVGGRTSHFCPGCQKKVR